MPSASPAITIAPDAIRLGLAEDFMRRFTTRFTGYVGLILVACALPAVVIGERAATAAPWPRPVKVESTRGMVVCVSPAAADAGAEVLRKGGTAVDAAVAVALAMAVTFPEAGNIGGGGFMMVRPADGGSPVCIEYRETAPASCTATTFANETAVDGPKTVGVPGTIRGLETAHKKFGKLPWRELVMPAVRLAREGFAIDRVLATDLNRIVAAEAARFPEFARVFGKPGSADAAPAEPLRWEAGDILKQPELADTLERIARLGPDEFYTGVTGELLVEEIRRGKGYITEKDLEDYRAVARTPVHGTYRGYDIYASPPPSSGGTVLVTMLNIMEKLRPADGWGNDGAGGGRYGAATLHATTEAMRRAYADRARWIGDPDYTDIPKMLTTKEHAAESASSIDPARASRSEAVAPAIKLAGEGESTTHFSVVDSAGMAVANTYTLQNSYGSKVVVRGAGFILNNEMTDFNWRPGHTDRQGKIGTPANLVAPGKRMLSSQTPTIVCRDGKLVLVTGSPGGRTIPNTVFNVVWNVLEFGMDVDEAVAAPRTHHQWFPDELKYEGADDPANASAVAELRKRGHRVFSKPHRQGDAHSILIRDGRAYGAADTRRTVGKAAAE
jgi:gamma-glutamyltranspeptidase/glutathione hydrolase